MLPIVEKLLIQYAVEEAIDAGATKLVFVTGTSKRAIEDHFDTDPELEQVLADSGNDELLQSIKVSFRAEFRAFTFGKAKHWVLGMPFCMHGKLLVTNHFSYTLRTT